MDRSLIDQYEKGGEDIRAAIRGLTPAQISAAPDPAWNAGKWTVAEVLIHLQDAEVAFADRIRRFIAEDNPTVQAWSENKFIANLHYADQSVDDAVALIDLTRRQLSRVLRKVPDSAFERTGMHSSAGRMTVADVLEKAVWHLEHHLEFVRAKRAKLAK